jgi:cystathionine beta-lyase
MSKKTKEESYRVDTLLGHLGRNPAAHKGVVNPPVYHASTLLFESLEALQEYRQDPYRKGRSGYGRAGTETTFALEEAIAGLDGGYGALALPSGLAAIVAAVSAFVAQGDHILMSDSVYQPNRRFCEEFLGRMGVTTTFYDPCIGAGISNQMRANTKLVFLESPGSHSFEVQDVPAIAAAARAAGVISAMDNSWATPLLFRPLDHGVDIAVYAATKYIVGHSDAMMGLAVTTEAHYERIRRNAALLGYSAAPDDVYLALRGLRTLSVRLARHQTTAITLARWLQGRPEVARVLHPGLPEDPGHQLWRRDFKGSSGLFGVVFKPCPKAAVSAFVNSLELFGIGASWGGYESLVFPSDIAGARSATTWNEPGPTLRFHAGLEDPVDLIADLEAGFERMAAATARERRTG